MKRHLTGERTGLGSGLKSISSAICWLLLFNTAYSQIPINGFCQLNSFPVSHGYNKFAVADVNYDSFNDYIFYGSSDNWLQVIERMKDSTLASYRVYPFYKISVLIPVFDNKTGSTQFFFSDRERRIAGLFYLTGRNKFNLIDKITFDSFPQNIDVSDVDEDGVMDYLVSGSGFQGLSIIKFKDDKLVEIKIKRKASYSEAVFGDISNDGFPDIIAFNLFTNSLDVFFNDEFGNFELIRSIKIKDNVNNLRVIRLNDEYNNIVYSSEGVIKVIDGDFESSYDNVSKILTIDEPDKFVFSDLNNDRLKDIAYVNSKLGTLSILFAKDEKQFYPEIVYLKKNGLADLKVIRKNYSNGLAVLDSKGEVFRVTRLSSLPAETRIIPAVQPAAIISFDYGNDGIEDICYLDKFGTTLNFLLNNYAGVPTYYCSIPVSANHDKIVVDEREPYKKEFYCYSPGKKLLEIADYNFTNDEYDSDQLYTQGALRDLAINRTDDLVHIYVAFEKDKVVRVGEYEHHYFRYNYREYSLLETGVIKAKLFITDSPELYYWRNQDDSLYFVKAKTNSKFTEYRNIGGLERRMGSSVKVINEYLKGDESPTIFTLFETDSSLYTTVSTDSSFVIANQFIDSSHSVEGNSALLNFNSDFTKNGKDIVVYIPRLKSFYKIAQKNKSNDLYTEKLFDMEDVKDYVVQKKSNNYYYIIYTRNSEGFLSLKRLR